MGTEPDPRSEVVIHDFSQSDWKKEPLERWVVLRPREVEPKHLLDALENIKKIADDPDYTFGIDWLGTGGKKVTSCAELIFREYKKENIVSDTNTPALIGPDYLFWYGIKHPDRFMIAGHN